MKCSQLTAVLVSALGFAVIAAGGAQADSLPLSAGQKAPATAQDVGCQGRVSPPAGKLVRLAAPADQGVPIVAEVLVNEGAEVAKGAVIAVLAAERPAKLLVEQAEARLKQAQGAAAVAGAALHEADAALARVRADAALAVCEARLAQLIAECELAGATAQGERFRATAQDVAAALATRDAAGSALNQLRALRAPLVAKLDAAVAAADLAAKQPFWDSEKKLAAAALAEATAARDLALAEHDARVNTAAGELAVLEARLAAVRAQGEIREREASPAAVVAAAKARVTAEGERASAVKKRSEAAVKEAEAALRRAEHGVTEASSARVEAEVALRLAEVRLELTRIKAPFAGRVLRVFARAGELIGHEGVAELADVSQTGVEAEVNVADIARVRVGAKAEVTLAGRTESFRGVVESISWRVTAGALADENPSAFRDLRVVRVRIALDTAGTAALAPLTGAQAQVKILR